MKFQSREESSVVSIFQEYIIGLNSLVEKKFLKSEYRYEQSSFLLVSIWTLKSFKNWSHNLLKYNG